MNNKAKKANEKKATAKVSTSFVETVENNDISNNETIEETDIDESEDDINDDIEEKEEKTLVIHAFGKRVDPRIHETNIVLNEDGSMTLDIRSDYGMPVEKDVHISKKEFALYTMFSYFNDFSKRDKSKELLANFACMLEAPQSEPFNPKTLAKFGKLKPTERIEAETYTELKSVLLSKTVKVPTGETGKTVDMTAFDYLTEKCTGYMRYLSHKGVHQFVMNDGSIKVGDFLAINSPITQYSDLAVVCSTGVNEMIYVSSIYEGYFALPKVVDYERVTADEYSKDTIEILQEEYSKCVETQEELVVAVKEWREKKAAKEVADAEKIEKIKLAYDKIVAEFNLISESLKEIKTEDGTIERPAKTDKEIVEILSSFRKQTLSINLNKEYRDLVTKMIAELRNPCQARLEEAEKAEKSISRRKEKVDEFIKAIKGKDEKEISSLLKRLFKGREAAEKTEMFAMMLTHKMTKATSEILTKVIESVLAQKIENEAIVDTKDAKAIAEMTKGSQKGKKIDLTRKAIETKIVETAKVEQE